MTGRPPQEADGTGSQQTSGPAALPSPRDLRVRRRALTTLLAASGGALLGAGCGGATPVPTSSDVPRDPLATLEDADVDARSAEELRALPVGGEATGLAGWGDLGEAESALDPARDLVVDFVRIAYLSPEELRGLEDQAAFERVAAAAPEFWQETLRTAWGAGERPYYAIALAAPFRTVGRPSICADWFRTEQGGTPMLALGATVGWTAIHAETRAVGVLVYRLGLLVDLAEDGSAADADLRVTLHGLDGCAIAEQGGLLVPALEDDSRHRAVQQATREQVLAAARIPLQDLTDEDSTLFAKNEDTYLSCR